MHNPANKQTNQQYELTYKGTNEGTNEPTHRPTGHQPTNQPTNTDENITSLSTKLVLKCFLFIKTFYRYQLKNTHVHAEAFLSARLKVRSEYHLTTTHRYWNKTCYREQKNNRLMVHIKSSHQITSDTPYFQRIR